MQSGVAVASGRRMWKGAWLPDRALPLKAACDLSINFAFAFVCCSLNGNYFCFISNGKEQGTPPPLCPPLLPECPISAGNKWQQLRSEVCALLALQIPLDLFISFIVSKFQYLP